MAYNSRVGCFRGGGGLGLGLGGVQQYCKALMTLVLRIGYGRCSHKLVVTHSLTLTSISYSFLKPTVSVNSKSSYDWYLEVYNFLPGVVELYGTMAGLAKGAEQPFMHCSSLLC